MIEINWDPSRKELRFFACGLAALALVVAGLGCSYWSWPAWATGTLPIIALAAIALGLFRPGWLRTVYLGWMIAVFPIGWTVSHVVLAVVYFTVFLVIGLFLRIRGYDPLRDKRSRPGESDWLEKKPVTSRDSYFRQY